MNNTEIFERIDKLFESVDMVRREPEFSTEVGNRQTTEVRDPQSDDEMLERLASLIAYSKGAKDKFVERLFIDGFFAELFYGFNVVTVARLDVDEWLRENWRKTKLVRHKGELVEARVTYIRFKGKIADIVDVARVLLVIQKEFSSFLEMLNSFGIPRQLHNQADTDLFWHKFRMLKTQLAGYDMPYFANTTSLLHLLLSLGYDCVKPDSAVQKAVKKIGIVNSTSGDKNLVKTVRTLQEYAVSRNIRTSVVDFYFLIYGEQSWAKEFVTESPAPIV